MGKITKADLQDAIMRGELNRMAVGIILMGHTDWFERDCDTIEEVNKWAENFAKLFE